MKTDALIHALAADNGARARPVSTVMIFALAAALPVSAIGFALALGPRADWRQALANPFFDLKFVVALTLAGAAAALCLRLARLGADVWARRWLLGVPVILLAAGIGADLFVARGDGPAWTARLVGTNSMVCLTAIPLLSLPLLAAGLFAMRHGAAVRPALAGAVAGLLAGGLAATLYAAHCTDDSPLFVATWYVLAIALVSLCGAVAGARVLRF